MVDPAAMQAPGQAPDQDARETRASDNAELSISIGQCTRAGPKPVNQDSMAARIPEGFEAAVKGVALAIADGISSSQSSQVAAETAVKALVTDYYDTPEAWTVKHSAVRVIEAINSWLYAQNRYARTSDMNNGLVCTLSAVIFKARDAHLFHVGDSRIYRFAGGDFEPLTTDHVTILSETEQYLGRAIGAQERVEIDYRSVPLNEGDVFLLTTDGVHEFIDAGHVRTALASRSLDGAAQSLVDTAMSAGSADNLTVQIARIDALAPASQPLSLANASLPLPSDLEVGATLDGFTLMREIHHTQRSRLYLAADPSGRKTVVKFPSIETGANLDYLQRFMFEEWVARRVSSAHIVKAATSLSPRSASYVAMEWVEGTTLRQWMHDHEKPSLDDVRSIAKQLVRGLTALHRREMIHQDLRPENVMLDSHGTAVIIDLGSVSVAGLTEASPGLMGTMPGTFQYTAPEYLSGDQVSWRADQFALGVMIYEMLCGRLPYGAQVARVRSRRDQQRLRYEPAYARDNAVPEWVDHALARACHRDPSRRYDALSEFIADLQTPSRDFIPLRSRPLIERNPLRFWQVLSALQFVALIVLLAVWLG
ncbi:MAG: protein kinase [Pseudomonadota bacterium]